MVTVAELIKKLQQFNPESIIAQVSVSKNPDDKPIKEIFIGTICYIKSSPPGIDIDEAEPKNHLEIFIEF